MLFKKMYFASKPNMKSETVEFQLTTIKTELDTPTEVDSVHTQGNGNGGSAFTISGWPVQGVRIPAETDLSCQNR